MGCFLGHPGVPKCVPQRCLRPWICLDRSIELVDLTSSAVYAACCYRRFLYGPAFNHEGEIYLAAAASLIASWFYIVMFHLHRTQEEVNMLHGCFCICFLLFPFLVFFLAGIAGKVTFSCVVGLVCGFLILESLCLCSIICNKEPLGPSAAFDVPLVGCCAAALQPPKTLREVVAFRDQHCAAAMGEFGRRVLAGRNPSSKSADPRVIPSLFGSLDCLYFITLAQLQRPFIFWGDTLA
ncbi:unnamed protein product [Durusdinium trenchii]|uniref:Uncharacterized protein n=1 Tax=Durusdinium trenchii TaxID=1381693 RepID=A0ABP0J1Q5_9DINO